MSSQMKKVLFYSLFLYSATLLGLLIIWFAKGFVFSYAASYVVMAVNAGVLGYFGYLYYVEDKKEKAYQKELFYLTKLSKLRERALLDFYIKRGIIPQYDKNGKLIDPDTLLQIVTKLDENGQLTKSIYELLGIEPRLDKNGKELPCIVVLKHLMGRPRVKDFKVVEKFAKMKAKQTANKVSKEIVKARVASNAAAAKESANKVGVPVKTGGIPKDKIAKAKSASSAKPAAAKKDAETKKAEIKSAAAPSAKKTENVNYEVKEFKDNITLGKIPDTNKTNIGDKEPVSTKATAGECAYE